MEQTKKTLSLKQKIVKIRSELRIKKDGKNDHDGYMYFKPDTIKAMLTPFFTKYQLLSFCEMRWNKNIDMYTAVLEIEDLESGEVWSKSFDLFHSILRKSGKVGPQDSGSTWTYADRYTHMMVFGIADNKADPDSNEITKKTEDVKVSKEQIQSKLNDLSKAKI